MCASPAETSVWCQTKKHPQLHDPGRAQVTREGAGGNVWVGRVQMGHFEVWAVWSVLVAA